MGVQWVTKKEVWLDPSVSARQKSCSPHVWLERPGLEKEDVVVLSIAKIRNTIFRMKKKIKAGKS